jgi:hypothetical protein
MQLSNRDLDLIESVIRAKSRAKLVRVMLFLCVLVCLLAFFTELLPIEELAYWLTAIVLVAVFVPNGALRVDEIAELLVRVKSEADTPDSDDIIQALSKR